MNQIIQLLICVFLTIILVSCSSNNRSFSEGTINEIADDDIYMNFRKEINVSQNCNEELVQIPIKIWTNSAKGIKIFSFEFTRNNFRLFLNGNIVNETDTLVVSDNHEIILNLEYHVRNVNEKDYFKFKTNNEKYAKNIFRVNYGFYDITMEDIENKKEHFVKLSESCLDSVKINFPHGGTVSAAGIFKDSLSLDNPVKLIKFGFMNPGERDYVVFSKEEKGRYYVEYGACHWSGDFWLSIE